MAEHGQVVHVVGGGAPFDRQGAVGAVMHPAGPVWFHLQGVDEGEGLYKEQGAGDQGLMFGFATNETPELMPMPIIYAHQLTKRLAQVRKNGALDFLRPDGKSQVTIEYENGMPKRVEAVVISTQHSPDVSYDELKEGVLNEVVKQIIPAEIKVIRHIRLKYACKDCEGTEDDGPTVKIAPLPIQFIPKGIATPGLVAQLLISKFEDALPFYRQEKIFSRLGIDIPRSTMCGWAIKAAEQCNPLLELLHQKILSGPLINIDETPVQVMKEPGRSNTSKSYMWVFRGGLPDKPVLIFQYHPTRSGQVPNEFLKDYSGYIQTDAYSGYDALGRRPDIYHVGCWSHARRMFVKVVKAASGKGKKGHAEIAIEYIQEIYAVEKSARKDQLTPDQIVALRQEKSKPVLEKFKVWLNALAGKTPPKGLLGKAVNYTLKNWPRLVRYLENGYNSPDNNMAENAIRPFVVGRKNWLFFGHPNGASAGSCLYSLIETAKACGLKPYNYLRYLFDNIPFAKTEPDYEKLLPQNLTQEEIENFIPRCA